ncbi:alkaline phosphatase family protein [archaeon]|nr:alkaline phosphatase family protein [archaeon]
MPQEHSIDNIVLIIIDQLRADYIQYLPRCAGLLPYHAICDTGSIPSSTEAMHANISTGKYPGEHGFVSKTTKHGKEGLKQILERMASEDISPLASIGHRYDIHTYIIGGKPETAIVLAGEEECDILLHYDFNKSEFKIRGTQKPIKDDLTSMLKQRQYTKIQKSELDSKLFDIFRNVFLRKEQDKSMFVLALPSLDAIGHEFGPKSIQTIEHLRNLDENISYVIEQTNSDSLFIITGDHGCRRTTTYLIDSGEEDHKEFTVYCEEHEQFKFRRKFTIGADGNVSRVEHDGGILRIWFEDGARQLAEKDHLFLSTYGLVIDMSALQLLGGPLRNICATSRHDNLGDVVVLANSDTTFCKYKWIEDKLPKIRQGLVLGMNELPLGEHGSHHPEDRLIPFLSNHYFGCCKLKNVQIRQYLEITLEKMFNDHS